MYKYLRLGLRIADTLTLASLQRRRFVVSLAGDLELASVLLSYELFIRVCTPRPCNGHAVFLVGNYGVVYGPRILGIILERTE